jgi:hypothetical protein
MLQSLLPLLRTVALTTAVSPMAMPETYSELMCVDTPALFSTVASAVDPIVSMSVAA